MTVMRFRVENHLLVANRPPLTSEQPHQVRLLPQAATQDPIIPWLIINHTQAASRPVSLESAWLTDTKRTDGIESHLLCDMDGRLLQSMPFNIVAHTSYKANRFLVPGVGWCGQLSVESQDQGAATLNQTPWSPAQFEVLCQAWAACCVAYGIPVQPVPSAYGRGVSQHNAFAEWSKSAHSCPGVARTAQMPAMRARIQQIIDDAARPVVVEPPVVVTEEDDAMFRYKDSRYANEWLLPHGTTYGGPASGAVSSLPLIVGTHDQMLEGLCWKAWGMRVSAAKAAGLLVV